jgi:hypothetical protein
MDPLQAHREADAGKIRSPELFHEAAIVAASAKGAIIGAILG